LDLGASWQKERVILRSEPSFSYWPSSGSVANPH
jgi:hypothetical protein